MTNLGEDDALQTLRILAAKHALGLAKSWEFAPAANLVLQAGIYSDSLAELASTRDPIMSDVSPSFERALSELALRMPEALEAAWILTRWSLEQVAKPGSSPFGLLQFLWWDVEHHHAIPRGSVVGEYLDISNLMGIFDSYSCPNETFYVAEQREIMDEGERRNILDRLAREQAIAWLERHQM